MSSASESSDSPQRLADKVVLLSGAAQGMGAAEAELFARHGARLVLGDVQQEPLQKLADALCTAGGEAIALPLDVTVEADWQAAISHAEGEFGRLDGLVNNAGIADAAGLEATSRELWDRMIAVNQTGTWLGMKTAAPAMRRAGSGSIVNISSIYGIVGSGSSGAYHGTKGAVRILTKTAAIEWAADAIRVNSVHPGYIDTPMLRAPFADGGAEGEELLQTFVRETTPLGRPGTAQEVAWAVLFLLSDESSFITGSELVVDGGYTAR